ncbi:MAG TPA: hypothetical protein VLJ86_14765 [Ramlibacter sp.]|nr:hypothetical protein [Ramlibacter sp.]
MRTRVVRDYAKDDAGPEIEESGNSSTEDIKSTSSAARMPSKRKAEKPDAEREVEREKPAPEPGKRRKAALPKPGALTNPTDPAAESSRPARARVRKRETEDADWAEESAVGSESGSGSDDEVEREEATTRATPKPGKKRKAARPKPTALPLAMNPADPVHEIERLLGLWPGQNFPMPHASASSSAPAQVADSEPLITAETLAQTLRKAYVTKRHPSRKLLEALSKIVPTIGSLPARAFEVVTRAIGQLAVYRPATRQFVAGSLCDWCESLGAKGAEFARILIDEMDDRIYQNPDASKKPRKTVVDDLLGMGRTPSPSTAKVWNAVLNHIFEKDDVEGLDKLVVQVVEHASSSAMAQQFFRCLGTACPENEVDAQRLCELVEPLTRITARTSTPQYEATRAAFLREAFAALCDGLWPPDLDAAHAAQRDAQHDSLVAFWLAPQNPNEIQARQRVMAPELIKRRPPANFSDFVESTRATVPVFTKYASFVMGALTHLLEAASNDPDEQDAIARVLPSCLDLLLETFTEDQCGKLLRQASVELSARSAHRCAALFAELLSQLQQSEMLAEGGAGYALLSAVLDPSAQDSSRSIEQLSGYCIALVDFHIGVPAPVLKRLAQVGGESSPRSMANGNVASGPHALLTYVFEKYASAPDLPIAPLVEGYVGGLVGRIDLEQRLASLFNGVAHGMAAEDGAAAHAVGRAIAVGLGGAAISAESMDACMAALMPRLRLLPAVRLPQFIEGMAAGLGGALLPLPRVRQITRALMETLSQGVDVPHANENLARSSLQEELGSARFVRALGETSRAWDRPGATAALPGAALSPLETALLALPAPLPGPEADLTPEMASQRLSQFQRRDTTGLDYTTLTRDAVVLGWRLGLGNETDPAQPLARAALAQRVQRLLHLATPPMNGIGTDPILTGLLYAATRPRGIVDATAAAALLRPLLEHALDEAAVRTVPSDLTKRSRLIASIATTVEWIVRSALPLGKSDDIAVWAAERVWAPHPALSRVANWANEQEWIALGDCVARGVDARNDARALKKLIRQTSHRSMPKALGRGLAQAIGRGEALQTALRTVAGMSTAPQAWRWPFIAGLCHHAAPADVLFKAARNFSPAQKIAMLRDDPAGAAPGQESTGSFARLLAAPPPEGHPLNSGGQALTIGDTREWAMAWAFARQASESNKAALTALFDSPAPLAGASASSGPAVVAPVEDAARKKACKEAVEFVISPAYLIRQTRASDMSDPQRLAWLNLIYSDASHMNRDFARSQINELTGLPQGSLTSSERVLRMESILAAASHLSGYMNGVDLRIARDIMLTHLRAIQDDIALDDGAPGVDHAELARKASLAITGLYTPTVYGRPNDTAWVYTAPATSAPQAEKDAFLAQVRGKLDSINGTLEVLNSDIDDMQTRMKHETRRAALDKRATLLPETLAQLAAAMIELRTTLVETVKMASDASAT